MKRKGKDMDNDITIKTAKPGTFGCLTLCAKLRGSTHTEALGEIEIECLGNGDWKPTPSDECYWMGHSWFAEAREALRIHGGKYRLRPTWRGQWFYFAEFRVSEDEADLD